MEAKMSLQSRRELLNRVRARYLEAGRKEKSRILDEFLQATGYHRKYAVAVLQTDPAATPNRRQRKRASKYGEEVKAVLIQVWLAANQICTKRLIPFLPAFVDSLERCGQLSIEPELRALLLSLSLSTADRLLRSERIKPRGRSTTRAGKLLKKQIPIRTFSDWNDVVPGFLEGDLVAHCGDSVHGTFLNTLTLTDIYSGWTECLALIKRSESEVSRGLVEVRKVLPFPMLGLDTDNGSEFINNALFDYCKSEKITFTRSRSYKKNDQAHVEEKNGSVVRRFIGYDRYESAAACQSLSALYRVMRLYVNFFQPSMKLLSKKRDGAKVIKKYDPAKTPCQRLMNSNISEEIKTSLNSQFLSLDPMALLRQVEKLQDEFWQHSWAKTSLEPSLTLLPSSLEIPPPKLVAANMPTVVLKRKKVASRNSLEGPSAPLSAATPTLSSQNAARRQYRSTKKPHKPHIWRTRKNDFANVWGEVELLLEANPRISALKLLRELQKRHPGEFTDSHRRTLQTRRKEWLQKKYPLRANGRINFDGI
jgi:hypothetical protein